MLDILEKYEELENELHQLGTEPLLIKFGAIASTPQILFPGLFIDFESTHPNIHIEIIEDGGVNILHDFLQKKFDFALLVNPFELPPDLADVHLVAEDEIVAFLPLGHPLTSKAILTWEDLAEYPLVSLSDKYQTYFKVMEQFRIRGLEPHFAYTSSSWQYLTDAIQRNFVITLMPSLVPTFSSTDNIIIKRIKNPASFNLFLARLNKKHYSLDSKETHSVNSGHEALGIIEEVGSDVTTVKPGDFVIVPFTHGCGHCAACLAGFDGVCQDHEDNFSIGFQSQYIRFAYAQWALVKVPGKPEDYSEGMLKSLLTLSDVMATGYHAARTAHVKPGDKVVVVGDGAVGQCAVIAAKMLDASQIIMMSRHKDRQDLALEFGATDIVAERGAEGISKVIALTGGTGADAVLECVGAQASTEQAMGVVRPGGFIGRVGLPHGKDMNPAATFYRNVTLAGGPASVTTYDKKVLLKAVLDGQINPGKVFTHSYSLDEINQAYKDMADRKTIKSLLVIN